MPDSQRTADRIAALEALSKTHFSPEELSELLGVGVHVIREAVRHGELSAFTVEHRIVDIRRDAAIKWLKARKAS